MKLSKAIQDKIAQLSAELAAALGLTDEQLDAMFTQAASLEV